jgi:hypothetical protein
MSRDGDIGDVGDEIAREELEGELAAGTRRLGAT